jgi:hypothetical protein
MLNLDGAALVMSGKTFTYEIPAPFGPGRGPATLTLTARPAASQNTDFRARLDELMHQARVLDLTLEKAFERSGNVDSFVRDQARGNRETRLKVIELQYDACILSWSTTIQNEGRDLEPTRDNFIALMQFEHPEIVSLYSKIARDLNSFEKFSLEADRAAAEALEGNSSRP